MLSDKLFQGKPCRHGHIGIRYKSNRHCVDCQQFQKDKYEATLTLEERRAMDRVDPRKNLAKIRKYKADKARRVPPWADLQKIKEFYINCPDGMVVDHIIPLRGELVSGLHVHNNLQYLTPVANAIKSNKFEIER